MSRLKKSLIIGGILFSLAIIIYLSVYTRMSTINSPTVLDYDPFWFFRHAKEIVENGYKVPKWDLLSYFPPGRPYESFQGWPYTIAIMYKILSSIIPTITLTKVAIISPLILAALTPIPALKRGAISFSESVLQTRFRRRVLASWLLEQQLKSVSVLFINNSWGGESQRRVRVVLCQGRGTVITVQACMEGDRDFRSHLPKLATQETQAIVAFTYGKEGGPFLRQARGTGIKLPFYGGDVWGSPELIEPAGPAADGVYLTFPEEPTGKLYDEFVTKYRQRFAKDPDIYASYAYDLTNILARQLSVPERAPANRFAITCCRCPLTTASQVPLSLTRGEM